MYANGTDNTTVVKPSLNLTIIYHIRYPNDIPTNHRPNPYCNISNIKTIAIKSIGCLPVLKYAASSTEVNATLGITPVSISNTNTMTAYSAPNLRSFKCLDSTAHHVGTVY